VVAALASGMLRLFALILLIPFASAAQTLTVTPDFTALAEQAAEASMDEFREVLAIANDAHFPDQVEANVAWTEAAFGRRGFNTQRLETGGPPLVLAELAKGDGGGVTVLVYLQMDGQPVDSSFWRQPSPYDAVLKEEVTAEGWVEKPWSALNVGWSSDPVARDYRVFARSASDAKGPVAQFLAAIDALRQNGASPAYNLKVILDFEEELGSPHLPAAVKRYSDALAADHLVILDGPMHPSNRPTLAFGARGISTVTLETFGPRRPQHSGHYGNYAPNPAWDLIKLLAPLKDEAGRVQLEGWYDGIEIGAEARAALEGVPDDEEKIRRKMGVARMDSVGNTLQEAIQYPSLNIRGIGSGWIREERRTIIPSTALVELDIRLVIESDPERLLSLLRKYIEEAGYFVVEGRSPTATERLQHPRVLRWDSEISYQAFRTDIDSPTGRWLTAALTNVYGSTPVRIRTHGGSIPISPFVNTLGVPAVIVPLVNADNNQHSPNENIRLGNYVDGIATVMGVLTTGIGGE